MSDRYPYNNTSEDIASGANPIYETPLGAQRKADAAREAAEDVADAALQSHRQAGGNEHPVATQTISGFMSGPDKMKLDTVALNAQPNQNAYATINGVTATNASDSLSFVGLTGISVTTDPENKKINFTATGQSTPGPHADSHLSSGSDPIPLANATTSGLMSSDSFQKIAKNSTDITQNTNAITALKASIVFNVKDFGAKGDGTADDFSAIQSAINSALVNGGTVFFPDAGIYCISSMLTVQPQTSSTALTGSGVHFSPNKVVNIYAPHGARLKATTTMDNMIIVRNNQSISTIAPYYARIDSLTFDCNSLVTTAALYLSSVFHATIHKCRVYNATNIGIFQNLSIGVQMLYNVVKAKTCVRVTGGGDSTYYHNDLYPQNNGVGFYVGGFSGNSIYSDNVISADSGSVTEGFRLDGTEVFNGSSNGLIGNLVIRANEFSGTSIGVRAYGVSASVRTVYNIEIVENHISAPFDTGSYKFIDASFCYDFIVDANYVNALPNYDMDAMLLFTNCDHMYVINNKILNTKFSPVDFLNTTDSVVRGNDFHNFGKTGPGYTGVNLRGTSLRNIIENNRFEQDTTGYATTAAVEINSSDYNIAKNNAMVKNVFGYTYVGANTVMRRDEYTVAIPQTGVGYNIGDTAILRTPTVGGYMGYVFTAAGWKGYGLIQT